MPACPRVKECPCPRMECPHRHRCCDCVINHKTRDDLPRCLRKQTDPEKEHGEKKATV